MIGRLPIRPSPVRLVAFGSTLAILIVLAVAGATIRQNRQRALLIGRNTLVSLTAVLAEQTVRSMEGIELVLDNIAQEAADAADAARPQTAESRKAAFEALRQDQAMYRTMKARADDLPQLDAVALVDADGELVNFSRSWPVPAVSVAERAYFKRAQQDRSAQHFLSAPIESRFTSQRAINMVDRVASADGQFLGAVVGTVDLSYFEDLYKSALLPEGTVISLWSLSGDLIARWPKPDDPNRMHLAIRRLEPGKTSVLTEPDPWLAGRYLSVERRLAERPIVVVVSRSVDDLLGDWQSDSLVIFLVAAGCIVAILLAAVALGRQFRAYEATARAMLHREEAIRARDRAEADLAEARRLESVGRLTAGVAHDFNNLLMTVSGSLDLLSRTGPPSGGANTAEDGGERAGRGHLFALMRQAVDRGAQLTRQLLAFSRQQLLDPVALDVNGTVQDSLPLLASSAGATVQDLLDLQADLPRAFADTGQMQDVLLNLLLNARDAMPFGGEIRIATRLATLDAMAPDIDPGGDGPPPGTYVEIVVTDQGTGMSESVRARAFEPFFTTKAPGKGSGLGLSQVHGIMRQSGGAVRLSSAPGEGTSVHLYLPLATGAAPSPQPEPEHQPADRLRGRRVLLVEDDVAVRDMLASMLAEAGCLVTQAENGQEALDRARKAAPELVLADLAMPVMDGLELARRLRAGEAGPCPAIVFMTGYSEAERMKGEPHVLRKPFRMNHVLSTIETALAEQASRVAAD